MNILQLKYLFCVIYGILVCCTRPFCFQKGATCLLAMVCDALFKALDKLLEHQLQLWLSFFLFFSPRLDQFSGLGSQHSASDNSGVTTESWTFSSTGKGPKAYLRGNSFHKLALLL